PAVWTARRVSSASLSSSPWPAGGAPSSAPFTSLAHDSLRCLTIYSCSLRVNASTGAPYQDSCPSWLLWGIECPGYHNPADYVMEVVCGEHGECVSKLVTAVNNGKCNNLTQPQPVLLDSSPQCMSDEIAKNYQTNNIVGNGVGKHGPNPLPGLSVTSALLDSDESLNNGKHRTGFPTSGYRQFFILLKRTFLSTFRD
ncbi:unnamed protein product, partial [Timema podura]|nr:unnamed protein product [Timema podura]